jgi:hypothetical protein
MTSALGWLTKKDRAKVLDLFKNTAVQTMP